MEVNAIVQWILLVTPPSFMLSANRNAQGVERFFGKALKAEQNSLPRVINVDKNAAYPPAIDYLKLDQSLAETAELRTLKYLNNIVEQDHRAIKRLVNPGMGFGSFNTARRTLRGRCYQAVDMLVSNWRKNNIISLLKTYDYTSATLS